MPAKAMDHPPREADNAKTRLIAGPDFDAGEPTQANGPATLATLSSPQAPSQPDALVAVARLLFQSSEQGLVLIRDGRVEAYNAMAAQALGIEPEHTGQAMDACLPELAQHLTHARCRHVAYHLERAMPDRQVRSYRVEATCASADPATECVLLITDTTEQTVQQARLRRRATLHDAVAAISSRFVELPMAEIDTHVVTVLEELGRIVGAQAAFVFELTPEDETRATHQWLDQVAPAQDHGLEHVPAEMWWPHARAGRLVSHPLAHTTRAVSLDLEVTGPLPWFIRLPIEQQGRGPVALAFDIYDQTVNPHTLWDDDLISSLRAVCQVFSAALHRKASEQALRESRERYRLLTEHQRDLVIALSLDGTLLYTSPACAIFGGYDPQDEVGRSITRYFADPMERPMALEALEQMAISWSDVSFELLYQPKVGEPFPVELTGRPVVDERGDVFIHAILRDVRERKRLEGERLERLSRVERHQQAIVDLATAPETVEGNIVQAAQLASELAAGAMQIEAVSTWRLDGEGGGWKNVASQGLLECLAASEELVPSTNSTFMAALGTGRAIATADLQTEPKARDMGWASLANLGMRAVLDSPLRVGGKITGLVRIVSPQVRHWHADELSFAGELADQLAQVFLHRERRLAAKERERLQLQLQRAQKMEAVGRLAGGIAHDFNNILTGIIGYSDVMLNALDPGDALAEDCLEIRGAAERAATLTSQLLTFSRKQIIRPRIININEAIEIAGRMISRLVGEDVALSFQLDQSTWKVKVDVAQVEQILINLATNARDAMPRGGKLHFSTANTTLTETIRGQEDEIEPGDYVLLTVQDSGDGMHPNVLPRVFEPFFTTKPPGHGTGLGLSTVYGIVRQHGGYVTAHSTPSYGTTFSIYLPRAGGDGVQNQKAASYTMVPKGKETILLVEDEDVVRRLALRILERQGYRVIEASHGSQAIELAADPDLEIDLLLTDVVMPGINGREVYELLEKSRPGLRVLFMSGYAENILARHGVLESGMELLKKPFTIGPLASKVREVLDSH